MDKENFLVVYNSGKQKDIEAVKVSIDNPEKFEKVNLPKKITSLKGKLDQFINIGHDNILVLATNDSMSNFAYIYSVKDILDDDKKDDHTQLKLANGHNPTIAYSGENWQTQKEQYFTFATSDSLDSSNMEVYFYTVNRTADDQGNDKYSDFNQLVNLKIPKDIKGDNLAMTTFTKPVPTPGRNHDYQAGLVFNIDGTNTLSGYMVEPSFDQVKKEMILTAEYHNNIGEGIYPAVAGLPLNTNMVMLSQDKKQNQTAQLIDRDSFRTQATDKSHAGDLASVATIYNDSVDGNPYFIYETSRNSDGSVMLNTYNYKKTGDDLSLILDKSIEIDKG
ncbi:hypothetical protein FLM55_00670 [Francisella sp. Scap27]|uniref:hypothetical protein n=1 Tax=Francisella sp. Scap27 TaxID=2589986 RepID=UPI0015BB40A7|nr:hypothetical protein [Francisella sp. Scap27]QLE78326.1 hypothetical protein FLM55_00670 [Francisella sp. Scap27]